MLEKSLQLTVQRVAAESQSGKAPGATTSIFKLVGSTIAKESASLKSELRGTLGFGWEGKAPAVVNDFRSMGGSIHDGIGDVAGHG